MFASVGRRLALLNAASVLVVIALVGLATFLLLRSSLTREADHALSERAEAARLTWAPLFQPEGTPTAAARSGDDEADDETSDGDHEDDDESDNDHEDDGEEEGHELIESGDTLLYAFDRDGNVIADARGEPVAGLPSLASVQAALQGDEDRRTVTAAGESVRIYTEPVTVDGEVVGAIQAARNQAEHASELRLVQLASILGIAFGGLIAIPSGLFLARRAMQPISAAFDRQRAFVADASHELRTPLAVIRANTELVQRLPDASDEVRSELGFVLDEVDGMTRLVDDLLLLARLDDSSLLLDRGEHDLEEIVASVLHTMEALAVSKELTVRQAPSATPIMARIDAGRIRQVVRILVDNAIKYTPPGGEISVTVERQADRALVTVTDSGIGVDPEEREMVFERFYRADANRSRQAGGAGLGLTIARALIEAHGGAIGLRSEPGHGTAVWFSLPIGA